MERYKVFRADHIDPVLMDTLFNFLKTDCNAYVNFERDIFNNCDIHIFTIMDHRINNIKGIIGIRETTTDEINIDRLDYYSLPHKGLYSIEFIHIFDLLGKELKQKAFSELLKASIADKNDGFTFFIPKCPITNTDPIYAALIKNNFKLYHSIKSKSPLIMFIRPPKVRNDNS